MLQKNFVLIASFVFVVAMVLMLIICAPRKEEHDHPTYFQGATWTDERGAPRNFICFKAVLRPADPLLSGDIGRMMWRPKVRVKEFEAYCFPPFSGEAGRWEYQSDEPLLLTVDNTSEHKVVELLPRDPDHIFIRVSDELDAVNDPLDRHEPVVRILTRIRPKRFFEWK